MNIQKGDKDAERAAQDAAAESRWQIGSSGFKLPDDELRSIHSRIDVLQQVIERIAEEANYNDAIGNTELYLIREMLEESQNPFEVSDAGHFDKSDA